MVRVRPRAHCANAVGKSERQRVKSVKIWSGWSWDEMEELVVGKW
jgi:hypothetical protein